MALSAGDVFTIDEVARAAGVPVDAVRVLVATGELRPLGDTRFFAGQDIVRAVPALRAAAVAAGHQQMPRPLFAAARPEVGGGRYKLVASTAAHALLLAIALGLTASAPQTAPAPPQLEPPRMVFLSLPGVGGGGGGSGPRNRRPARRLERADGVRATVSAPPAALTRATPDPQPRPAPPSVEPPVPQPAEAPPEPPAEQAKVVAPVVATAAQTQNRDGVVEHPEETVSRGVGTGGADGAGRGEGSGSGTGSGIGDGSGGGTGGGPFRPGSGIQPPRLLREVKAEYTEEARRRNITGDVELEIVVRRDGSVGDVTLLRGLGLGLDQRAIAAVRLWQFAPARRRGEAVDVIVEVSVEFKLR